MKGMYIGLCAASALVLAANLSAQTTLGTILGTATDPSGALVSGVTVVVRNTRTNIETTVRTDANGLYQVPNLLPGPYSITGALAGFKQAEVSGVLLETSATVRVDLHMEIGNITSAVTVSASTPVISTETSDLANVRSSQMLLNMPINQRGPGVAYNILLLTPGGIKGKKSKYNFSGTRGDQTTQYTDGTGMPGGMSQISLETTGEVRLQLSNDKAESASPGGIYASSKSGSNEFHGSLFAYNTNSHLVARNTFSATVPFQVSNDYGATLGGPLIRNRTFFMVAYERYPQRNEQIFRPNVPTLAMRSGDFSALLPGKVVKDPLTGQPFPGNMIPTSRLSSTSLKAQDLFYPTPNTGAPNNYQNNWQGTRAWYAQQSQAQGRLDHKISEANSLFVRWSWASVSNNSYPSGLPTLPHSDETRPGTMITVSDTHIFRPNVINEFRYGLFNTHDLTTSSVNGPKFVSDLGLQGLVSQFPITSGMPTFGINEFTQIGGPTYYDPLIRRAQYIDSLTWIAGKHTFKTGVELDTDLSTGYQPFSPTPVFGTFNFTGVFSGFGYSDFLLGIPQTTSRLNPSPEYHLAHRGFSAYFQDDWKITRRLTLNLGLRYDFDPSSHERDGRFFMFDASAGRVVVPNQNALKAVNPLFPTNLVPVTAASAAGLPESLFYSDKDNFVPRFGFAYRPFTDTSTVIRGGFGIYTQIVNPGSNNYASATGGPFTSNESFTNSVVNGVPLFAFPRAFPQGFGSIGAQSFTSFDPYAESPKILQWNLTVERDIRGTGLRASYIGTGSRGLLWGQNLNQPPAGVQPFAPSMRRFPAIQNVVVIQNGGTQQYQALQVVAERKSVHGLYYQLGWTWSKNLTDVQDEAATGDVPPDSYNRWANRGDVSYSPRHHLVGHLEYELPFGPGRTWLNTVHGVAKFLLGGWNLNGSLLAQTGDFFTPSFAGYDVSNTNSIGGRPDRIANGNLAAGDRTLTRWFDASAFRVPGDLNGDGRPDIAVGRFGNTAPNVVVGPSLFNLNAGLQKEFAFGEKVHALLEGSFTNVLNHANYNDPASNISSPGSVGRITSAQAARAGRVGVRVEF